MRSFGYQREFRTTPWPDLADWYRSLAAKGVPVSYLLDIVQSVADSSVASLLHATTSMHDLVVTDDPEARPVEVVIVRGPGSLHPARSGVRIEHQSHTGRNDLIERPEVEAVTLFWRFVLEKFGVRREA